MAWVLTVGQRTFTAELDEVFPDRDRRSDGTIGDAAHRQSRSGHNPDITGNAEHRDGDALDEVRAADRDKDLVPGSAVDWMERVVQHIVRLARSGAFVPFRYIIYKGRIWSAADGWVSRTYTGANRHDQHAHFSGGYSQRADNWTGRLGLAELRRPPAPAIEEDEDDMTIFAPIRIPDGYAYQSTGPGEAVLIDRGLELTLPFEPAGFAGSGPWKNKRLNLSLYGDRPDPEGPEIVRVAIHDGLSWHVDFYEATPKTRVKIEVPPAASDNAYGISLARVARAHIDLEDYQRQVPAVGLCYSITPK